MTDKKEKFSPKPTTKYAVGFARHIKRSFGEVLTRTFDKSEGTLRIPKEFEWILSDFKKP